MTSIKIAIEVGDGMARAYLAAAPHEVRARWFRKYGYMPNVAAARPILAALRAPTIVELCAELARLWGTTSFFSVENEPSVLQIAISASQSVNS